MTEQTAKDIAQVVDILETRQHELGEVVDTCPSEIETLEAIRAIAQGMLDELRGKA